ncbi:diacylglycerol kinase family protein [Candidatus Woesebacteria bacterium]|nr:diacylglycerol kinase family protein [Candidatus Woesebacteria bacterium]
MSKTHKNIKSIGFALEGIKVAIKEEPNFKVHVILAILALVFGFILKISHTEWIILMFTIVFVLVLELINTALEEIVDIVSPKVQPKAKIAKDVAAGAVLITAIAAIIVGLVIFLPKII